MHSYRLIVVCFFCALGLIQVARAQDLHFSQYSYAPLLTNPAGTGDMDNEWRFIHNYRSQWYSVSNPFSTYSLSFEKNIIRKNRQFGVGMNLLYDKSGIVRLQIAKINLSGSYQFNFYRQTLRFGLQAGWNLYQYSLEGLTTDNQWDQSVGYFNPALSSGEINDGESMNYLSLNTGVLYRYQSIGGLDHRIGISLFNLNQPRNGFDNKLKTPLSISGQYSVTVPVSSKIRLTPNFIYRYQQKADYLLIGLNYSRFTSPNEYQVTALHTGIKFRTGFNRNSDAVIIHGGLSFLRTEVGMSYDFNVSKLSVASGYQGAFELYLVYQAFFRQAYPGAIPCSRQ